MSEQVVDRSITLIDPVRTFIDRDINNEILAYAEPLQNGAMAAFRKLRDVGKEIDEACMSWALVGEDTDPWRRAVSLRAMHVARKIDIYAQPACADERRDYFLGTQGDKFWQEVDKAAEYFIGKLMFEQYGVKTRPVDRSGKYNSLCELNTYHIKRAVMGEVCGKLSVLSVVRYFVDQEGPSPQEH